MTLSTVRRGLAAASSVLVLVLGASACASQSPDDGSTSSHATAKATPSISPVAALREAVATSENVSSKFAGRITATVSGAPVAGGPSGDTFAMRLRGAADPAAKLAEIDIALSGAKELRGTIHQIVTPKALYMSGEMFPPGKWVKVSLTGSSPLAKAFKGGGMADPAKMLDALGGASGLTRVGTETVRGDETTHYRGTLDIEKALDTMGGQLSQQMRAIGSIEKAPFDVWIDADNRVRRVDEVITMHGKKGESARVRVTMEMFGYGTPVTVTPPPAKDVIRAPKAGPA